MAKSKPTPPGQSHSGIAPPRTLPPLDQLEALVAAWLHGKAPETQLAYERGLRHYAGWVAGDWRAGLAQLVELRWQQAQRDLHLRDYHGALRAEGLSPTVEAVRLSAFRSFIRFLDQRGSGAELALAPARERALRTRAAAYALLSAKEASAIVAGTSDNRDRAILLLIAEVRLRPAQVAALDYPRDLDMLTLPSGRRTIGSVALGGDWDDLKARRRLSDTALAAVRDYLTERGESAGPLFRNRDRRPGGERRLSGTSIARIVATAGERIGRPRVSPALLRRAGQRYHHPWAELDERGG